MTIASAQAQKFYEQVTAERRVFTFLDDDSFWVFRVRESDVVPFWSSASRLRRVQAMHPKYRTLAAETISLADFLEKTLPQLEEENIGVGVNWSGTRLVGYNLTVAELRRNLEHRMSSRPR